MMNHQPVKNCNSIIYNQITLLSMNLPHIMFHASYHERLKADVLKSADSDSSNTH